MRSKTNNGNVNYSLDLIIDSRNDVQNSSKSNGLGLSQ